MNIIDALIVDQERAMLSGSQDDMSILMDTFTEVCMCDGVDLVNLASNLGGLRDDYSSALVTDNPDIAKLNSKDVNFPDKDRGFLGLSDRSFTFIGPDRQPVVMNSIHDYTKAADIIKQSSVPNYQQARIHVTSNLNIAAWERCLQDYPDQLLIQYLKFGFPLSLNKDNKLNNDQITNHFLARQFPEAVDEYLAKEIKMGAIIGPDNNIQCTEYHSSPLLTGPKDGDKRRIILDLSYPRGASVNYQVDRNMFDNQPFVWRFPTIDDIVQEMVKDSVDKSIFKIDIGRAFRNLRVDPADALQFGIQWRQNSYVDGAVAFGWVHGSTAFQMVSDAIVHIMSKQGYKIFVYIDDFVAILPSNVATEAFQLGLPINPDKVIPPCKALTCLGIHINLEIKTYRIQEECHLTRLKKHLSRKAFQSLLGKLLYVHKCVRPARTFVNGMLSLFRNSHNHKKIKLTTEFYQDLDWFLKFCLSSIEQ